MGDHLVLQLSDIHLCASGSLRNGARTAESLAATVAHLIDRDVRADVIVCTGDLTDDAAETSYRALVAGLAPLAAASGARLVYLPGNHDRRAPLRRYLLGEESPGEEPVNQIVWHEGLRIVAVDSTVPGAEHGALTPATLGFLAEALANPAPDGTLLALHHPPIRSPIRPMAAIALRAPEELAQVLRGSDVRLIVAGHNHHESAGTFAGIPVWVSPALAYRADVASTDEFRSLPGTALSRIELPEGGAPHVSVLHVPVAAPGAR